MYSFLAVASFVFTFGSWFLLCCSLSLSHGGSLYTWLAHFEVLPRHHGRYKSLALVTSTNIFVTQLWSVVWTNSNYIEPAWEHSCHPLLQPTYLSRFKFLLLYVVIMDGNLARCRISELVTTSYYLLSLFSEAIEDGNCAFSKKIISCICCLRFIP